MAEPVQIAIVGNAFAQKLHLPALRWAGNNRVVGLCGKDPAKARATADRWDIPFATGRWEELLERDCDLVVIATPVHLHHAIAKAALERGRAVLLEKPMALDVDQAQELAELARGRPAWIDHQLRFSPWRRALRAELLRGAIGEVWHADFELTFGSPQWLQRPYGWWFDAARGGGALGALGSHMIDCVQRELGPVREVRAELRTFVGRRPDEEGAERACTADELASVWMRMQSGASVNLSTSVLVPGGHGFHLLYTGSEGSLRLDGENELWHARHGEEFQRLEVEDDRPTPNELGIQDHGPFARALPLFLREVVGAVSAGRTTIEGAASFEDGLAVQRVLDAARASARGGSWISCQP